ncbi:MAG TPA: LysR family transcriptional regulator [Terriglobales bacterium]|nr:LysR family transcriptional regulator [Terriglobales bacterium]
MLNLNHLRLFAAAAASGSVSAAAERLRISQPAISKQIRELELSLGATLLERLPRGVRPTPAGELLADYARRLFALEEEAEAALAELRDLRRGRLRLGASMTVGVYLLPEMLARFQSLHPGIAISAVVENTDTIQAALIAHQLDLGLVEGPGQFESDLESHTFAWDELIVVTADGPGRLPGRGASTLRQLAPLPWIMREPGSGTRALVDQILARARVQVTPTWIFNSPEAIKQAVMAGLGVAIVSRMAVESEISAGRLREIKVSGHFARRRPLRLQWLRARPHSAALKAFMASSLYKRGETPAGAPRARVR